MQISSLVKISWDLLKLLSWNENTDVSWADNFVKNWCNLIISNPEPDLHNINAPTKFGKKPVDIYLKWLPQLPFWKPVFDLSSWTTERFELKFTL